jgi:NAD(P)-dependent dehydrogenase (short-subunit alcohol dehydrogenase family)
MRLTGKVAVVTGASLGIGRAIAILMAKEGAKVAITDIKEAEGLALAEEIKASGGEAAFWRLDVSRESEVAEVFSAVKDKFGPVSVLVNNAGIAGVNKPTHEIALADWDKVININVGGVFLCTKYAIPQMKEAGQGSIINLSSIYGLIGNADVPPYHASKGAVRLMSKNDALIYARDKIRVNSIHPGFIWTPMVDGFLKESFADVASGRQALDSLHPLGHIGEPDDIAWGAVYLASDESKFVTGTELIIDGGYTAR